MDTKLVSGLYKYPEVDRFQEVHSRSTVVDEHTFKAVVRKDKLPKVTQELNLNKIVSKKEATWYAPQANACMTPLCDIVAKRYVVESAQVHKLEYVWLSRLAHFRLLIRHKDNENWFFAQGDCCGVIFFGWPACERHVGAGHQWVPVLDGPNAYMHRLTLVDYKEWLAMPYAVDSPMHQAILIEGASEDHHIVFLK